MDAGGPAAKTRDMRRGISTSPPTESVTLRGARRTEATTLTKNLIIIKMIRKMPSAHARMQNLGPQCFDDPRNSGWNIAGDGVFVSSNRPATPTGKENRHACVQTQMARGA